MKINRFTHFPELWKPFPYAVNPERRGEKLFYSFRLTRERVMGLVLFGGITLIFVSLSVWQIATGSGGGLFRQGWFLFAITIILMGSFLWSVYNSRKQSQVCINLADGQTQIQYQHKENAELHIGDICVVISRISKQSDSPNKGINPFVRLLERAEGDDVNLVVIRAGSDFEVVGAFKSLDSAILFAQVVQSESGLEIVEDEMPALQIVEAERSHGTKDSKAMNMRFRSRPFRA